MISKPLTIAEIDLTALADNYKELRRVTSSKADMMAVVKADGYGHGAVQVAQVALKCGCSRMAVARYSEAVLLRDGGITAPVLLLGYMRPIEAPDAQDLDFRASVNGYDSACELSSAMKRTGKKLKVHIKVDSGMGRLGILADGICGNTNGKEPVHAAAEIEKITKLEGLEVEGIFTHFASSDALDKGYANQQLKYFTTILDLLEKKGIKIPIRHSSNSAAVIEMPYAHMDMVRPGIAQYGLWPSDEVDQKLITLKPVMSLKSTVIHVKDVPAGFKISYGSTFETKRESKIATIPVGYADGYFRNLSNKGIILAGGKRCQIVGRVCMDLCMIDVTEVPGIKVGDEVVVMGKQGDSSILAEEIASLAGTINYEIVTSVSPRVKRIYK